MQSLRAPPRSCKGDYAKRSFACDECINDLYYDVDFRVALDRYTYQGLLPHILDLRPFAYSSEVPQGLIDQVTKIPYFHFFSPTGTRQVRHAVWCRHHQTLENFATYWTVIARISRERPTLEKWKQDLSADREERRHLCHNTACEHPYHSTPERASANRNRKPCRIFHTQLRKDGISEDEAKSSFLDFLLRFELST